MNEFEAKSSRLKAAMKLYAGQDVAVAFSGGADSSLLLKMACESAAETGKKVYAVTAHTMLHPSGDLEIAKKVVREAGAEHFVIEIDEMQEADILNNPENRCYRCKKCIFRKVKALAGELGTDIILEGTNEDDLHVYRPGIQAVHELGIKSPLAEAGLTKSEVRKLAAEYGISVADRPSAPCLATRFPYGTALSYKDMHRADTGEEFLRKLGFYNIRLRIYGDLVRMEVDQDSFHRLLQVREEVVAYLKSLGYAFVTLDLEGFRSGSMDYRIVEAQSK